MQVHEKVEKWQFTVQFSIVFCGSGGSKSRLAKAAGAEPSGQMRDEILHTVVARSTFGSERAKITPRPAVVMRKNCTPLWREAHFEVNIYKAHHAQTTFGS